MYTRASKSKNWIKITKPKQIDFEKLIFYFSFSGSREHSGRSGIRRRRRWRRRRRDRNRNGRRRGLNAFFCRRLDLKAWSFYKLNNLFIYSKRVQLFWFSRDQNIAKINPRTTTHNSNSNSNNNYIDIINSLNNIGNKYIGINSINFRNNKNIKNSLFYNNIKTKSNNINGKPKLVGIKGNVNNLSQNPDREKNPKNVNMWNRQI